MLESSSVLSYLNLGSGFFFFFFYKALGEQGAPLSIKEVAYFQTEHVQFFCSVHHQFKHVQGI